MLRWIVAWWYRRLRRIDIQILWPSCKAASPDLDKARAIFAVHAFNDHAWSDLDGSEILRIIDRLE